MPSKISLVIMCTLVTLLLAPYAGCNAGEVQTHSHSDEASAYIEGHERSAQKSEGIERSSATAVEKSLDGIEELLGD